MLSPRKFKRPDLSTKLKLLGVEVASFGDFFADRDGPKELPVRARKKEGKDATDPLAPLTQGPPPPPVKALSYKDPFQSVYKKYLFTMDGKYLLGGMMIGDTKDYVKLVPMVKNQKPLEVPPSQFILGAKSGGEDDADDLYVHPLVTLLGMLNINVGTMTRRSAHVIMLLRVMWPMWSKTVAARALAMSNRVPRREQAAVAVCHWCKPSLTRR